MRIYKIPFDVKHEDKIFGGYLSLRQVVYLLCTILSGGLLFIPIYKAVKITLFVILATVFVSCAFVKIQETRIDKFIVYIIKYIFRKKLYFYER